MQPEAERRWIRTEWVLFAAALAAAAWLLGNVLLMVFAGALIAVGLDGLASGLARRTPLSRGLALAAVGVLIFALLALFGALVAPQFAEQFRDLQDSLVDFVDAAERWFGGLGAPNMVEDLGDQMGEVAGSAGDVLSRVAAWGMSTLGALTSLIVILVIAFFAAADPQLYRRGFLRLIPPEKRPLMDETLAAIAYALRWWFLGQLVSMALLGATVSLGLLAVGVDLWLALGVLTALLTFIPFIGPLIAGVPIVIVGFTEGVEIGIIVAVGYLVIQNLEGNVIVPMIQHKAVNLAPALLISLQVLMSLVFGIPGLILAAPLTVVGMVLVKKLYLKGVLGDEEASEV
jgi:predicted PurR-regulated permease PerM